MVSEVSLNMCRFPIAKPGPGEVLLKVKASSICASDVSVSNINLNPSSLIHSQLHCIYRVPASSWTRDHEGYFGCIAGHEPAGQIVSVGPQVTRFKAQDRCLVFHVRGCDDCDDCRMHRPCSCTMPFDPTTMTGRMAYGWQTDGGMAEYLLCKASSLVKMPDAMSYIDGAMLACGVSHA
jgi:D-arabinose 1-dehydrogenase-like Zn-dependent alcohol dehydrogenase